jgi:hypothetical protein
MGLLLWAILAVSIVSSIYVSCVRAEKSIEFKSGLENSDNIKTGDLIHIAPKPSRYSELDDAILLTGKATVHWLRQNGQPDVTNEVASHVAIAWRDSSNSSDLYFVQALPGQGVILTSEVDFFHSFPSSTTVYVSTVVTDTTTRQRAAEVALAEVGKPYADDFQSPPEAFYCSSLVDWAYSSAMRVEAFLVDPSFTLLFVPEQWWQAYYDEMGEALPANTTGSNPTLTLHSAKATFHVYES